ncbi:hypothetical protein U1Q18_015841 [Sarracenia purpurea var. burkii]
MCPTGTTTLRLGTTGGPGFRSAFEVIDADRDGKISKDDLRSFCAGFSGAGVASDEDVIGTMMSVADSNGDGYVEYEEFERVLGEERNAAGGRWGVMEDVFKVMDRDGDGRVGDDDLRGYLKSAGFDTGDEDIKAMIRLGGGDDDRRGVTFEGFLKILGV